MGYLPDSGMRKKREPSLEYKRNNTCPVEEEVICEMLLHVIPMDVVYDERESMQQRKQKEGIGDPSMEYLESFVRYASEQRNPVCLASRCAGNRRQLCPLKRQRTQPTYKMNGIHPKASHPERVPNGGEPPNFSLAQ